MKFTIADSQCPWCDRPNNGHFQDQGIPPEPGASTICLHCMGWGFFEAGPFGLVKRRATAAEVAEIEAAWPEIVAKAKELRARLGIIGG